jgi:hypothetical protein
MLLDRIKRREMRLRATVDQAVGSAVFGGSKKAASALKKLMKTLEDD